MQYQDAVAEARRLVKRSEEDQWRLAELTWEQVKEAGKSQRQWAEDVGVSAAHVNYLAGIWETYRVHQVNDRPAFRDAYAEVKGLPVDAAERRQMEADRNVANRSVAERARMAAELLEDEEVAEEVEEMQLSRRGPIGEPLPDPEEAGRKVANNMARAMDTDLASSALRSASGFIAEAILCREEYGIRNQVEFDSELERHKGLVGRLEHGDGLTQADREWAEANGVSL